MKKNIIKEKKHRLSLEYYKGKIRVTFTLCIKGRKNVFINLSIVNNILEILREVCKRYDCKNWVYMFMPDHLHIIIEGNSEESDLWKAIVAFKQKAGFWLSKNMKGVKWQKDFYDHIHRKDEDLERHINYILNNPVRKGLVTDWQDYPFKGSLDFILEDIIS